MVKNGVVWSGGGLSEKNGERDVEALLGICIARTRCSTLGKYASYLNGISNNLNISAFCALFVRLVEQIASWQLLYACAVFFCIKPLPLFYIKLRMLVSPCLLSKS